MATTVDFSKFSFTAEQIRDVKELLFDEVVKSPEIQTLCTIYPNIVFDKEIGFIGEGGMVGKAAQGCSPSYQAWNIGTRKVTWEPKEWGIYIQECFKDLESTCAVYSLKHGVKIADFTDSDYMAIVLEVLSRTIKEMIIRLSFFTDKDIENAERLDVVEATEQTTGEAIVGDVYAEVTSSTAGAKKVCLEAGTVKYISGTKATGTAAADTTYYKYDAQGATKNIGGVLTEGVSADYFNLLDGFWKQIETQCTANAKQKVTITENAGASYAAQALGSNVLTYLQKLVFGAPIELRSMTDGVIICTQSFYDAYAIQMQGKELESTYANMVNGMRTLTYNGIPLMPIPTFDKIINANFNDGAKLYKPHRALYTTKAVLALGVDGEDSFDDVKVFFNETDEYVRIKAKGKMDAKLANPALFEVAM